jgi:hypothetical protein
MVVYRHRSLQFLLGKMQIPDINIPCRIEENYLRIDDQSKLNLEASISVRDSASANDVDYILLNNDE